MTKRIPRSSMPDWWWINETSVELANRILDIMFESLFDSNQISMAFKFSSTKEGASYWWNIHANGHTAESRARLFEMIRELNECLEAHNETHTESDSGAGQHN